MAATGLRVLQLQVGILFSFDKISSGFVRLFSYISRISARKRSTFRKMAANYSV